MFRTEHSLPYIHNTRVIPPLHSCDLADQPVVCLFGFYINIKYTSQNHTK